MAASKTVLEVLNATTDFFKKHGVESAQLNAQLLMAHVLGKKNKLDLYMEFERTLEEKELAPLRDLVKRRAGGEPLQHLLGTVEFHGRTFLCDKRALIPRPETEQLVEKILHFLVSWFPASKTDEAGIQEARKDLRLADVGTGSGVIALTLAAELPEAKADALDISEDALSLARENAQRLGLSERVNFFQSNLFEKIPADARYDLIAANLPYIASEVISTLSREVQRDPKSALDGGTSGMEILERFAEEAKKHLKPNGTIALELGADQGAALSQRLRELGYQQIRCEPDYQGVIRFLFAVYG